MIGDPKYDVVQIKEAYDYLMTLEISSTENALWKFLHLLIWHKGIDRVDWILQNKQLIGEIIKYNYNEKIPDHIVDRFWKSVQYYKKLDR